MSIAWPQTLKESIARRRAVLLIGSGISANSKADDGSRPPTWGAFLERAYLLLGRRVPHIANALKHFNYLEACDYLKSEHGANWHEVVRSSFVKPNYKPADIHEHIFNLDCRIVASLNFDRIYESYALPASDGTLIVKNYYDADIRQVVSGYDRYVIKPHGSIDTISRMIFTLEDYAKARVKHAPFYELMTSLIHTHTFLCIGCGLSDPDMKMIFEDYRYKHGECPHFMTLSRPFVQEEINLVQKTRGINVLTYSARDGHAELTKSIQELVNEVAVIRDVVADLRSW
ncbi:SIR2 family protein [uncultured Methylobacterium sp.]|uniref:SIR2 family protein n=1 Tax=uncultured Methylobacterium sp. TaxID=157278 RepID=UPI0035CA5905